MKFSAILPDILKDVRMMDISVYHKALFSAVYSFDKFEYMG